LHFHFFNPPIFPSPDCQLALPLEFGNHAGLDDQLNSLLLPAEAKSVCMD
jgi:hypothetical protein